MTKVIYEKPVVEIYACDIAGVMCASSLTGGLDDVTRNDVDWAWGLE